MCALSISLWDASTGGACLNSNTDGDRYVDSDANCNADSNCHINRGAGVASASVPAQCN